MRLIDADKMRENLIWCKEQSGGNDTFWDDAIERLDVQPTIDAVPVRSGRWIKEPDRHNHWHCSECGFTEGFRAKINKYCPNCGADMREGEEDAAD